MKILLVVWNFYPNTAYTNRTKATVRGFAENGCSCDVLSIKPVTTRDEMCLNHDEKTPQNAVCTFIRMMRNYRMLKRVVKDYDVVYCATGDNRIVRQCIRLASKYSKVVVHERTELPDIFYGESGKARRALAYYLEACKGFDHLFVISNAIKDYFVSNGVAAEKISLYPMIVDPNRFANVRKKDVGYRYVAYCGNLSNSKDGVADLINAYGLSQAKNTYKLMLIGTKPSDQEMMIYRELINKHGIVKNVIFRGSVERDEMPQVLTDADLLVLSRPNNRQALGGFPTKLGEYLSTGNPVLVTRVGDIDRYIIDGENGYLSEPDNVMEFSKKIDSVFADYEAAKKVGDKGKDLAYGAFHYGEQTRHVVKQLTELV